VTHRPDADSLAGVFELSIDSTRAGFLSYSLEGADTMYINYVEIDPARRGRRLGDRLIAAAVEWARANRRQIVPICAFARAVLRRTPAYHDVLKR
jgi:hypothetical protein